MFYYKENSIITHTALDLVKSAADISTDARIVFVSSEGYKLATKIDYNQLKDRPPGDKDGFLDMIPMFQRYCTSKLAIIYMAMELNRRLLGKDIHNIFVNAIHPGILFLMSYWHDEI